MEMVFRTPSANKKLSETPADDKMGDIFKNSPTPSNADKLEDER
jgi:hypothetical protein